MPSYRLMTVAVLAAAGMVFAEPSTQPAKKPARLVQPWSKVTDLSADQRDQLLTIHAEYVAKMNALRAEERERCEAVLSAEQRATLEATLAREAAERKGKSADKATPKAETDDAH